VRLLNPGPGEILDRMTVLRLKVKAAKEKQVPFLHFEMEYSELMPLLTRAKGNENLEVEFRQLALANKNIWDGIDCLRHAIEVNDIERMAKYGKEVLLMNDMRARLIGQVNRKFGITEQEKFLHQQTA
jgi:hypothetical protein